MIKKRHKGGLPGFGLSMGFTLFYLTLLVLLPLSTLFFKSVSLGWEHVWQVMISPRTLASLRLSFTAALSSTMINAVFGFLVAWILVRYDFPGKKILDALIDLPFALPTAVAGIALTALYSPKGWLGRFLYAAGIQSAFSPFGITMALVFIGLPFVVRSVEPVLQNFDAEIEEAALSLGANRWQVCARVIFPSLLPALLNGSAMAFARVLGEYGSVVFIAGNMPMKTEITPLLIMIKLEQYDYAGATSVAVVMLLISFAMLFLLNLMQFWSRKYELA